MVQRHSSNINNHASVTHLRLSRFPVETRRSFNAHFNKSTENHRNVIEQSNNPRNQKIKNSVTSSNKNSVVPIIKPQPFAHPAIPKQQRSKVLRRSVALQSMKKKHIKTDLKDINPTTIRVGFVILF